MARTPEDSREEGPPPERPAGEPIRDLYPTMDARFVLVEIGKLGSKVDRLIDDVKSSSDRLDAVRHQITFVKGALWVLGFVVTILAAGVFWYLSGRIGITIKPPP
jgi:hypothetical protein